MDRRAVFAATAFLLALVALLPMRLALDGLGFARGGLSARAAIGSLWLGALHEAQIGPVPLGDLSARLNLLPLLLGRAKLSLAGTGTNRGFEGAVTLTRHGLSFDDVDGQFRVGPAFAPLPLHTLALDDLSVRFENGRCDAADGRVRALLGGDSALGLGTELGGRPRCAGDALLIPLTAPAGAARLDLRVSADGSYRLDLLARVADPVARARLVAAGFRPAGPGLALQVSGRF